MINQSAEITPEKIIEQCDALLEIISDDKAIFYANQSDAKELHRLVLELMIKADSSLKNLDKPRLEKDATWIEEPCFISGKDGGLAIYKDAQKPTRGMDKRWEKISCYTLRPFFEGAVRHIRNCAKNTLDPQNNTPYFKKPKETHDNTQHWLRVLESHRE